MKHNEYVEHQDMKMYCATNQFTELMFLWPHNKPHGVHGLDKNYCMLFDPKLGNDKYAIHHISCDCTSCTSIIDQPWITGFTEQQQNCYQTVQYCRYCPELGSFNNWNILKLSHKATSSDKLTK